MLEFDKLELSKMTWREIFDTIQANFEKVYNLVLSTAFEVSIEQFGGGLSEYTIQHSLNEETSLLIFRGNQFIGDQSGSDTYSIEDNKIILEAGSATPLGGGAELDDCYEDEYEDAGFSIDDLTAQVLSTISKFHEFVVYGVFDENAKHDLKLESVVFSDGQKEYVADVKKCEFNYQTD